MISKLNTIWLHKKKSAFAIVLFSYGLNAAKNKIRDDDTRRYYAEKAKKIGMESIAPNQKLRRVTVLVNKEANGNKAAQMFTKNALPLLNLAGLDVNVINVNAPSEMRKIASVINRNETDSVYLIGGDGTVCHFLTGMFQSDASSQPTLPIGIFPGGRRNKSFTKIWDFKDSLSNVHRCCESALALIEGTVQNFYPLSCTLKPIKENSPSNSTETQIHTYWLLGELAAGWFEYFDQRTPKFWWTGFLRERFTCAWELLKASPRPLKLELTYEEYCPGCSKCIKSTKDAAMDNKNYEGGILGWLNWIAGGFSTNKKTINPTLIELAKRENSQCDVLHVLAASATDLHLCAEQEQHASKLVLRIGETFGRFGTLKEAWRRNASGPSSSSSSGTNFTKTSIQAKKIRMHFTDMPVKINKLAVSGEWIDLDDVTDKEMIVENSRQPIQIYIRQKRMEKT